MKQGYCLMVVLMCGATSFPMQQKCHVFSHRKVALLSVLMLAYLARVEAPQPEISSSIPISSSQIIRNDQFFLDSIIQPLMATPEDSYPQAVIKILGLSLTIATLVTSCFSP